MLQLIGVFGVFVMALVITGFIPAIPLFQGRMMIGWMPLFAAWWMLRWSEMGLHLSLAAGVTGIIAVLGRLRSNKWQFSLKTLLLLMTLVAAIVGSYVALSGATSVRNGSQLP